MSGARSRLRAALAAWVAASAVVLCNSACSVDSTAVSEVILPNRDEFINQGVSNQGHPQLLEAVATGKFTNEAGEVTHLNTLAAHEPVAHELA